MELAGIVCELFAGLLLEWLCWGGGRAGGLETFSCMPGNSSSCSEMAKIAWPLLSAEGRSFEGML